MPGGTVYLPSPYLNRGAQIDRGPLFGGIMEAQFEDLEVFAEPKMEQRQCAQCSAKFKVMLISKQKYCSNNCHIESGEKTKDNVWADLNKASLEEKKWKGLDTKGAIRINHLQQKKERAKDPVTAPKIERVPKQDTTPTKKKSTPVESDGVEPIENGSLQLSEPTTLETKSESENASMQIVNEATQPVDSLKSLIDLREEILASMSLCRHTARHLYGLMRDLNPKAADRDTTVRLLEQDRCRTAAELGKQTISAMRMSLDMLKFAKEMKDEASQ